MLACGCVSERGLGPLGPAEDGEPARCVAQEPCRVMRTSSSGSFGAWLDTRMREGGRWWSAPSLTRGLHSHKEGLSAPSGLPPRPWTPRGQPVAPAPLSVETVDSQRSALPSTMVAQRDVPVLGARWLVLASVPFHLYGSCVPGVSPGYLPLSLDLRADDVLTSGSLTLGCAAVGIPRVPPYRGRRRTITSGKEDLGF